MQKTFKIPAPKIESFRKKVSTWSRRAQKAGLDGIAFLIDDDPIFENIVVLEDLSTHGIFYVSFDEYKKENYPHSKVVRYEKREYYDVVIPTEIPCFDGYELIAVIDHRLESGNIINQVSSIELPEKYRNGPASCDHCNHNRKRHTTLILYKQDDGTFHPIGKTCIKLYLKTDIHSLIAMAEMWPNICNINHEFDVDCDWSGFSGYNTLSYLVDVAACIRTSGWSSRSNSDNPTSIQALNPPPSKEEDIKLAQLALSWAQELEAQSNFESNMKVLASELITLPKYIGTVAYIVQGYLKYRQKSFEQKSMLNEYVGTIGEKISFEAYVTNVWVSNDVNRYGKISARIDFDADGNVVSWWTNTDGHYFEDVAKIGQRVKIDATVKEHKEFRTKKQTIINYPSFKILF